jgi:hypothetical protein
LQTNIRVNSQLDGDFFRAWTIAGYVILRNNIIVYSRSRPQDDTHSSGQLFKFPDRHVADAPHYVFNNTWELRWPIAKKKTFSDLFHGNNLIGCAKGATNFKMNSTSPLASLKMTRASCAP